MAVITATFQTNVSVKINVKSIVKKKIKINV